MPLAKSVRYPYSEAQIAISRSIDMTTFAVAETPKGRRINDILTRAVFVAASIVIVHGFFTYADFSTVAEIQNNPSAWEHRVFLLGVLIGAAYTILSLALYLGANGPYARFWKRLQRLTNVHAFALWFLTLSLVPLGTVTWINSRPHILGVPPDSVRLMNDGRIVTSGMTAVGERYKVTSQSIPLQQVHQFDLSVKTSTGIVEMKGTLRFRINPADGNFQPFVARSKERFAEHLENQVLAPVARDTVLAVQTGMLSGSQASLITHLGYLIHNRKNVPSWATQVSISDVSVSSWTKQYE